jgi:hypothetical protein
MPRISITTPITRGHTIVKANTQATYDALRTLINTTKLGNVNFADNAGVPEHLIAWDVDSGHDHRDGSLGDSIITDAQLNVAGERGVQWVLAQTPGVKMIAGVTPSFPIWLSDEVAAIGYRVAALFGQGAEHPTTFDPGTTPTVIATIYDNDELYYEAGGNAIEQWNEKNISLTLEDVTSAFFTLRYKTELTATYYDETVGGEPPTDTWRAFYVAIGRAPGYLTNPAGV